MIQLVICLLANHNFFVSSQQLTLYTFVFQSCWDVSHSETEAAEETTAILVNFWISQQTLATLSFPSCLTGFKHVVQYTKDSFECFQSAKQFQKYKTVPNSTTSMKVKKLAKWQSGRCATSGQATQPCTLYIIHCILYSVYWKDKSKEKYQKQK